MKLISKEEYRFGVQKHSQSKSIMNIFFVILLFAVIFFPIYGITLRYQLGYIFQKIFDTIGVICLTGGTFLLILCFIGLIVGRSIKVGLFVVAIVLLWIGCWCNGTVIEFFGVTFGDSASSGQSGYY